jgi:DHA2 family multidrug resistance protein
LGLTVQTTFVTALSVVPMRDLARGSSLSNATRNVVQSIGVALLATILASTISPPIQDLQNRFSEAPVATNAPHVALCAAPNSAGFSAGGTSSGGAVSDPPPVASALLKEACVENVAGFERAYTLTFYAAFLALLLGVMLPGWPFKWAGRRAADVVPAGH